MSGKIGAASPRSFTRDGLKFGVSVELWIPIVAAPFAPATFTFLIMWLSTGLCAACRCSSVTPVGEVSSTGPYE